MKKLLCFLLMMGGVMTATAADVSVYFKPNSYWLQGYAQFALFASNGAGSDLWIPMSVYDADQKIYSAAVSDTYNKFIICRVNSATDLNNLNSDDNPWANVWNQCPKTTNVFIQLQSKDAYYTIANDVWSTDSYDNSLLPWGYYLMTSDNSWSAVAKMNESAGIYTYTFNGADYAGKYFTWAPGSAFWADGGKKDDWSQVIRPAEKTDTHWVNFENYNYATLYTNNDGTWYMPKTGNKSQKTNNSEVTITYNKAGNSATINCAFTRDLGTAGFATFSYDAGVTVPDGVDAYYASGVNAGRVVLTKNTAKKIAANDGALLVGIGTVTFTPASDATEMSGNKLVATVAETPIAKDDDNYVLSMKGSDASTIGFYLVSSDGVASAAGKAYLHAEGLVTEAAGARAGWIFSDEATGIEAVKNTENDGIYFDMQGRRIAQPAKGLYIVNGKKVIVK